MSHLLENRNDRNLSHRRDLGDHLHGKDRVQRLGHILENLDDLGQSFQLALPLDDGRGRLFPEDIVAELSRGLVGHEMGHGVFRRQLITEIGLHQRHGHGLDVPEIGADAGPAQFDADPHLAGEEGALDVVRLHLLRSAAGRLRPHELDHRVAQDAADLAGPGLFRLEKGVHRTDLRPQAHPAVGAGVLVDLDIDPAGDLVMPCVGLNPSHRTIGEAPLACYALILVCLHTTSSFVPGTRSDPSEFPEHVPDC